VAPWVARVAATAMNSQPTRLCLSVTVTAAAACLLLAGVDRSGAQTTSYAHAVDWIGDNCGKDIDTFCKDSPLGEGRILKCLSQNRVRVSPICRNAVIYLTILVGRRAAARADVVRICEGDTKTLCPDMRPGDRNLLECLYSKNQNLSAPCRQAMADAGYDLASSASDPTNPSLADLVNRLKGAGKSVPGIGATGLRQLAAQGISDPSRGSRVDRPPLTEQLNSLPQFNIAVRSGSDSARIPLDVFKVVALIADALHHPLLQGDRFLIVGHTEGQGDRTHNLKLSKERAEAIRQALINPFGISPSRIEAVGLGEEQLLNRASPEAIENRRIQLINVGK